MKKLFQLLLCLLPAMPVFAQVKSNVIVFTENGEKFSVILNGLRQNETPLTNVKLVDLTAEFYKMKVIFADAALGEKMFNLNISMQQGNETSFVIKKNNKGEYVLRFISSVPVAQAPPTPKEQTVVVYHETAPATGGETVTQQSTTTTTTTGTGNPDNVNISIGVNAGETGGGINMNISGMDATSTSHSHTTTTTTVSHSTTSTSNPPSPPPPPPSYLPGYNGPIGCPVPMSPQDFNDLKSSIESKGFEETKMTIAKQVVGSNCILVSQVKQVMPLFGFEQTKLDFAKFAYRHTYDIGNYFKVNDEFGFESSVDDLNRYIESQR